MWEQRLIPNQYNKKNGAQYDFSAKEIRINLIQYGYLATKMQNTVILYCFSTIFLLKNYSDICIVEQLSENDTIKNGKEMSDDSKEISDDSKLWDMTKKL